jgi:hypothetical protein
MTVISTPIDVQGSFKPSGEDVRLLILHSTKDALGEKTSKALTQKLSSGVVVVDTKPLQDFRSLRSALENVNKFNALLIIAHGDKANHEFWLRNDADASGRKLGINAGELKAALEGKVDDKLILFATCYAGTDDLMRLMVEQAVALVCVAPKSGATISNVAVIDGYSMLLNKIQAQKAAAVGAAEIHAIMSDTKLQRVLPNVSVWPSK